MYIVLYRTHSDTRLRCWSEPFYSRKAADDFAVVPMFEKRIMKVGKAQCLSSSKTTRK